LLLDREHDEWMARLYGDDPPVEQFTEFCRRVSEQLEEVWPRCLELGVDVVLDFGWWTRRERDCVRAKIAAIGAEARLYRSGAGAGAGPPSLSPQADASGGEHIIEGWGSQRKCVNTRLGLG
jgi:hypothetical protein